MAWIVGNVLRLAEERSISQRELALACNVTPAYWSHARGRASGVSLYVLCRASVRLGVEPKDLLPSAAEYEEIRSTVLGLKVDGGKVAD